MRSLRNRYASHTAREREVVGLVVTDELNKQVGGELGISEITVQAHPRQGDAKDEGRLAGRPREYGRETVPHARTERLIRP